MSIGKLIGSWPGHSLNIYQAPTLILLWEVVTDRKACPAGVLQSMGTQRVRHELVTKQQQQTLIQTLLGAGHSDEQNIQVLVPVELLFSLS